MSADIRRRLVSELIMVRERGILRVESPSPRLKTLYLPLLREAIAARGGAQGQAFPTELAQLIRDTVDKLPAGSAKQIATIIFGLDRDLFSPDPVQWRRDAVDFYSSRTRIAFGLDDFRKGPELEILGLLASHIEQLIQKPSKPASARDLLLDRSIAHIVRTLEVRRLSAHLGEVRHLDEAITSFRDWHLSDIGRADEIIAILDRACDRYLGRSIYNVMGELRSNALGPEHPPSIKHADLRQYYPGNETMVLVEGGFDPFTQKEVKPFFIAVFPVTAIEWQTFLTRFNWPSTPNWAGAFVDIPSWQDRREFRVVPAFGMTYYDCVAYCFWLWLKTDYRFRLPTEAEWNFAATAGQRINYPWGNDVRDEFGHFSTSRRRSGPLPLPLLKPAGEHGLVSMSGNMWEYVSTLWLGDEVVPDSDVEIPDLAFAIGQQEWWDADRRIEAPFSWREYVRLVLKGGSWGAGPEYATVETRAYSSFYNYGGYAGLRLAVDAVLDPITGKYTYARSPFIRPDLTQARFITSSDFASGSSDDDDDSITVGGGCMGPMKLSRKELQQVAQDMGTADWEEMLRFKYELPPGT